MGVRILTDPHAHLDGIAARCGAGTVDTLLAAYAAAQRDAGGTPPFIVDIGVDPGDLDARVARYGRRPFVRFTAGLWPGKEALCDTAAALRLLDADLARPECAALGECGLDYHHMDAAPETQMELFAAQIERAEASGLTLVVHSRDAAADTIASLEGVPGRIPVLIHCFGYGPAEAEVFLDMGCHISFAGNLTYKSSKNLREALVLVPGDRLLVETDSPYMNPLPERGRPSTPLDIVRTCDFAASLRGEDPAALAAASHHNAARLFSVPKAKGNSSIRT